MLNIAPHFTSTSRLEQLHTHKKKKKSTMKNTFFNALTIFSLKPI